MSLLNEIDETHSLFYFFVLVTHKIVIMLQLSSTPSTGAGVFSYTENDFLNYLNYSQNNFFTIDLSNASLLEVIEELIKMKSKMHPQLC